MIKFVDLIFNFQVDFLSTVQSVRSWQHATTSSLCKWQARSGSCPTNTNNRLLLYLSLPSSLPLSPSPTFSITRDCAVCCDAILQLSSATSQCIFRTHHYVSYTYTMPLDTTPLLAAVGSLPGSNILQDHVTVSISILMQKLTFDQPAFLRASHSPWNWIPQRLLVKLRGLVVAYLTGSGCMSLYYKLTEFTDHPKLYLLFHFGSLSFLITLIYHLITFVSR